MGKESTSLLSNGLLWFGAAVSIAEIMAGTLFAPLGFAKGFAAIILGHLIGCLLLYLVGLIGAKNRLTAMESVRISFGRKGSVIFSVLNILQLLGWTAVMIISGARAVGTLANPLFSLESEFFWSILIGLLIILWIAIGIKNLGKLNIFAVGALFILTVLLSFVVFKGDPAAAPLAGAISFGMAVELSVAMPLSWLPLISDYTSRADKPAAATLVSTLVYFAGSCWMYTIGLGAAIFAGETDVAQILLTAGLGIAGILIVLLATVTTTFLDVFSAGVSFTNITDRISEKKVALAATIIGTLIAMFTPIEQYENFLYLIGSVFAPMVAILVTDYFILGKDSAGTPLNVVNLLLWLAGFIIYRQFMTIDTPLGSTLPVMIVIVILSILVNGGKAYVQNRAGKRHC